MRVNVGETIAAASVAGFGALMIYLGSDYPVGSLSQMGPGYFPALLGVISIVIGIATAVQAIGSEAPAPDIPWRAFMLVFAGVLAWALMVERFGLVPASVVLIVLASLARPPVRLVTMVATAVIASVAAVLVFIEGFGLPLAAVRW